MFLSVCASVWRTIGFAAAVLLFVGTTAMALPWENRVIYETDFEAPVYAAGYLVPQDGWTERWDSGSSPNRGEVVASPGYGQALYNYRASSAQRPNHDIHSLGTVVDSGVATLSFDARRVDTPLSTGWLNVLDSSGDAVAAIGMEMPSTTDGFRVQHADGTYEGFGSLAWDTWYHVELAMRFSGPGAGTYDMAARRPDGAVAAQLLSEPFNVPTAQPEMFRVRTYGSGSGLEVDNVRYEDGAVLNKVMHGDFDGLEVGTGPDTGAPIGGWSTVSPYIETDASQLTIVDRPGGEPGDHALRIHKASTNTSQHPHAQQIFAEPYAEGEHKLIVEYEVDTVAGRCGHDFNLANGSPDNAAVSYGLRNEGSAGAAYQVKAWHGSEYEKLAAWTPGCTYQFRTSVDLATDTFDLYLRSPDDAAYQRWTQIGKQIPLVGGADAKQQIDRLVVGQWYKLSDVTVDNVSAFNSVDLGAPQLYNNSFERYALGSLLGQDGWVVVDDQAADPATGRCQILSDPNGGQMAAVTATNAGSAYTSLYQDLDVVADFGDVTFSVDSRWTGGSSNSDYAYFVLGDSELLDGVSGFAPSAATFGFRKGQFLVRDGDAGAGWLHTRLGGTADSDTWYRFTATVHTTGVARNTWDLDVYDRDTGAWVWGWEGLDFRTDYTDITRVGMFVYDLNAAIPGTLYFDNMTINVPEPATMLLLGGGLVALARRRRRA